MTSYFVILACLACLDECSSNITLSSYQQYHYLMWLLGILYLYFSLKFTSAVKDEHSGTYLLNGKGKQGHSRQFIYHGSRLVYISKRARGEILSSRGPLQQDLLVLVCTNLCPSVYGCNITCSKINI